MRNKRWFAFVGWDGVLPLLVASSLDILRLFFQRDAAEVLALIFVPMSAALIRCVIGVRQMHERAVYFGWLRPCLFSGAIVVLMLFDGLANLLRCNGVPVGELAPIAGALYATYVFLIWLALRKPRPSAIPFGGSTDAS